MGDRLDFCATIQKKFGIMTILTFFFALLFLAPTTENVVTTSDTFETTKDSGTKNGNKDYIIVEEINP